MTAMVKAQVADNPPVDLKRGQVETRPGGKLTDFTFLYRSAKPAVWAKGTDFLCEVTADKVIARVGKTLMEVPADGSLMHAIALVIKRDPRQATSGLWVDGVECASAQVAPGELDLGTLTMDASVVVYDRPLSRPEIIQWSQSDDALTGGMAIIGSTEAVSLIESGYLEALLAPTHPVRCLAWEGDTIFEQDRPLNFGSLTDQIHRVKPRTLMVWFGRQECLELGYEGIKAFRDSVTAALKSWKLGGWIIGPAPFEAKPSPLPYLGDKNDPLNEYNKGLREIAKELGYTFVDLMSAWPKDAKDYTRDGVNLTDKGCLIAAQIIAGTRQAEVDPAMLKLIKEKNQLWHQYWRPSNWAFLYGDRTAQPSSRDHMDPRVRWFPQELEQYRALITAKEKEIWKLTQQMGRKLP